MSHGCAVKFHALYVSRNSEDYFGEVEQAAFNPGSPPVPGIGPSPDKMLQGRLFNFAERRRKSHTRQHPSLSDSTSEILCIGLWSNCGMSFVRNTIEAGRYPGNENHYEPREKSGGGEAVRENLQERQVQASIHQGSSHDQPSHRAGGRR